MTNDNLLTLSPPSLQKLTMKVSEAATAPGTPPDTGASTNTGLSDPGTFRAPDASREYVAIVLANF